MALLAGVAHATVTVRVGWLAPCQGGLPINEAVAFLSAVRQINSDPERYLGNASARVEPTILLEQSESSQRRIGAMRVMEAATTCDVTYVTQTPNGMRPHDLDVILIGGGTSFATDTTPIAEFNAKPVMSYNAQGDELSNKALYPNFGRMVSPHRFEINSLVRTAAHLGWSRIGVLYTADETGRAALDRVTRIGGQQGLDVVASVEFPTGIDILTASGGFAVANTADLMSRIFDPTNVKVYLLVVGEADVFTALAAANRSGIIGPGHVVLLPAAVVAMERDPVHGALQDLLDGSMGVFPIFHDDSTEADVMWDTWPKTEAEWAGMLNTLVNFDDLNGTILTTTTPAFERHLLPFYTHYVWDTVVVAARAIVDSIDTCAVDRPGRLPLEVECIFDTIWGQTHPYVGATGSIFLSNSGDRSGIFSIFFLSNGAAHQEGTFRWNGSHALVSVDLQQHVWSDGSTNRTSVPDWGQQPLNTSSPTAPAAPAPPQFVEVEVGGGSSNDSDAAVAAAALGVLLLLAIAVVAWRRTEARRRKLRPRDFRKIIARLEREAEARGGMGLDFRGPTGGGDGAMAADGAPWVTKDSGNDTSDTASLRNFNVPRELRRRDVLLHDVLGQGQFGQVCAGVWTTNVGGVRTAVAVAIKTAQMGDDVSDSGQEDKEASFLVEAAVTWQFDHDNVVRMHGVVTVGTPLLIVLELCEKGCLRDYLRITSPEPPQQLLLGILCDVARGMQYLAELRVIHRDLASRNILLNHAFCAKVSDFGLGRTRGDDDYYRMSSSMLLPMRWTDPWAVDHLVFNEATDVWSFGVTAVEIFQRGERPYGGWSNVVVIEKVKEGYRLERPPLMPHDVYTNVVRRCWATDETVLAELKADADGIVMDSPDKRHEMAARYFAPRPSFAEVAATLEGIASALAAQGDASTGPETESDGGADAAVMVPPQAAAAADAIKGVYVMLPGMEEVAEAVAPPPSDSRGIYITLPAGSCNAGAATDHNCSTDGAVTEADEASMAVSAPYAIRHVSQAGENGRHSAFRSVDAVDRWQSHVLVNATAAERRS